MMSEFDTLDALLEQAGVQRPLPSSTPMTRILQDAHATQPKAPVRVAVAPQRSMLSTLADWFGGSLSLAGMSAAALAGIYLGVMPPTPVLALAEMVTGQTTVDKFDVLPQIGPLWAQE